MPTQISGMADARMHELSGLIGKTERRIKKFTAIKDQAWENAFEILDEFSADEGTRFVANDGHTLTRQKRQGADKLNTDLLVQRLQSTMNPADYQLLWNSITERVVNTAMLEAAVRDGKIPLPLVTECTTLGTTSYARVRREWTKDDEMKAQVFRLVKTPEPADVEEVIIPLAEYEELRELQRQMTASDPATPPYTPPSPRRRGRQAAQ